MTAYPHAGAAAPRQAALRIAVVQGALPDDWRQIHERLDRVARGATGLFLNLAAGGATFAVVVSVGWALAAGLLFFFPGMSAYALSGIVILPALLAGAGAGQAAGNVFLRVALGLDAATRRGFATRLSLARCPGEWPGYLRRWLFTGDWLGTPAHDLRVPYARIYVEGEAPLTCREEDGVWGEIHGEVSGEAVWEAGTNYREISYPGELPCWAMDVANGDGFQDLRRRIGERAASEWVLHLWRRACRQWPDLGDGDYPGAARRECFEMHFLTLSGGRRALVVVLRPVAFVDRLERDEEVRAAA